MVPQSQRRGNYKESSVGAGGGGGGAGLSVLVCPQNP